MSDDEPTVCDCGVPLDIHPPLPKPGPLHSDHALKHADPSDEHDWLGRARIRPVRHRTAEQIERMTAGMRRAGGSRRA